MSSERERKRRERALVTLIEEQNLQTQSELVQALENLGIRATQATVSRDIKRLGLVKAPLPDGGYRYRAPRAPLAPRTRVPMESFVLGYLEVESFLALKTLPGRAMAVATTIDEQIIAGVSGTLAGDDLVLVLIERAEYKQSVRQALDSLF